MNVIKNICVLGAGNMGHQISLCAAIAGYTVKCWTRSETTLKTAEDFAKSYIPGRVSKGKMTQEAADAVLERISFTTDFDEAARDADLVIETVAENLELKRDIFARLDKLCKPEAILTTNSSYIVASKIADATNRPDKVCNFHFFNPALVMKLAEIVKNPGTSDETIQTMYEVAKKMGKDPVILNKEIYGFLANRFTAAIRREALYLLDMGIASPADIDTAVKSGLNHPMGPFEILDLVGIDLAYKVTMDLYRETGDALYKPSPYLTEKYVKGELGRKTGKGFYEHQENKK